MVMEFGDGLCGSMVASYGMAIANNPEGCYFADESMSLARCYRAQSASKEKDAAAADFDLGEDFWKTIWWSLGQTKHEDARPPRSGNVSLGRTSRAVPAQGLNISHGSRKTAEVREMIDESEQEQEAGLGTSMSSLAGCGSVWQSGDQNRLAGVIGTSRHRTGR
jgi:hypothetical protein